MHTHQTPSLAIYLHIPFCQTRCTYCDFNTYTNQQSSIESYMHALAQEAALVAGDRRPHVHTIYFGGGTPSLVPPELIAAVLHAVRASYRLRDNAEITLEANPGTVTPLYLSALRRSGINRLSIGMQSAHDDELRLFARGHTAEDVSATVHAARQAGFDNISLDLIYGVPYQTLAKWKQSLEAALRMNPDHLSLYALGIEDGTPMQRWVDRGQVPSPDPDRAADMYDWASSRLAAAGHVQYEISNWAVPGRESQHNLQYWRNLPYLGLGAGAHGYANHVRYMNVLHPAHYIERIASQEKPCRYPLSAAADTVTQVSETDAMSETMFMGLRLLQEGVSLPGFAERFKRSLTDMYGPAIKTLVTRGLLEITTDDRLRLTPHGRLISNQVFLEFV